MPSRRSFLRLGASSVALEALGLRGLLSARAAAGDASASCKLVIMVAYGGWDPTWVLDPKPDSPEVDLVPGDVQMFGDLPIWTDPARPSVTEFFTQWADRSAVINGISVESLAHETCAKVMLTGRIEAVPDLGARVADRLGGSRALPYLALSPHAKTHGLSAQAGRFGPTNQLMALCTPELGWPQPGQALPDRGLNLATAEREAIAAYLRGRAEHVAAAPGSERSHARLADYDASLRRAEQLQAAAREGGVLSDGALFQQIDAPWEHVAGALAEGLSQVALVQPDLYWDTHDYNAYQAETYEGLFAGLGALMAALDARGIVDETVVLVVSEMGRTPRHNHQGGKDHWPWTSAMVVGPGVRGGRALGTTDEWLKPRPLDLDTGTEVDDGVTLHAEHVLSAVAQLVGVDPNAGWYEREALRALWS